MLLSTRMGASLGIRRIISGGQTGVDRAALDVAMALGIPHGGWVPRGRLAEDGIIPARYQMWEMDSTAYSARTERNVVDSDATLIISSGPLFGGSKLTLRLAKRHGKPVKHVDLAATPMKDTVDETRRWLMTGPFPTLNIAGPRADAGNRIGQMAADFLKRVFAKPS